MLVLLKYGEAMCKMMSHQDQNVLSESIFGLHEENVLDDCHKVEGRVGDAQIDQKLKI